MKVGHATDKWRSRGFLFCAVQLGELSLQGLAFVVGQQRQLLPAFVERLQPAAVAGIGALALQLLEGGVDRQGVGGLLWARVASARMAATVVQSVGPNRALSSRARRREPSQPPSSWARTWAAAVCTRVSQTSAGVERSGTAGGCTRHASTCRASSSSRPAATWLAWAQLLRA